ncbi:MAG: hypothetical protein U0792_22805 [Gemmataceae bacterium]
MPATPAPATVPEQAYLIPPSSPSPVTPTSPLTKYAAEPSVEPPAHPDGPEPPLLFWWRGKRIEFTSGEGQQWNTLNIMWPKYPDGKLSFYDFQKAWPRQLNARSLGRTIAARISEANAMIEDWDGMGRVLRIVSAEWICWVKKNTADTYKV